MKTARLAFAFAVLLTFVTNKAALTAQAAPRVTTTLSASELTQLDQIRKAVWVNWYSGDTTALRRVLSPELVAISDGGSHWQSLSESINTSAAYKTKGGKFVSVAFDSATTHRFGETVVMFAHYVLVTESGGQRATKKGRVTEVFVRTNGRWVHTSWHIDGLS